MFELSLLATTKNYGKKIFPVCFHEKRAHVFLSSSPKEVAIGYDVFVFI